MTQAAEKIYLSGIVPVVKLENEADGLPLAKALMDGGVRCIEVTFRAKGAAGAIKAISKELPDMLVGAGTVLTVEQAQQAVDAGADFIVAPGLNERIVRYCLERDVTVIPGVSTPSEIEKGLELGLTLLKFFPAEVNGGVKALSALAGPYQNVRFIPTGGINETNINDYLALPNVIACGGTWMVKDNLVRSGNFAEITRLTNAAVRKVLGIELRHIGINTPDQEAAAADTAAFCDILCMESTEGSGSFFVGLPGLEILKGKGRGTHGHIGFVTNSVDRTYAYLSAKGYQFNESSRKEDASGLSFIYLKDEYAGFGIHFGRR